MKSIQRWGDRARLREASRLRYGHRAGGGFLRLPCLLCLLLGRVDDGAENTSQFFALLLQGTPIINYP